MRVIKEDALESRDEILKYKKSIKKMEDNWQKKIMMDTAGIELRMRELMNKLKVECKYADKEHEMVQKETNLLVEGMNKLTDEGVKCQYRVEGLESFVGAAAELLGKNLVDTERAKRRHLNV